MSRRVKIARILLIILNAIIWSFTLIANYTRYVHERELNSFPCFCGLPKPYATMLTNCPFFTFSSIITIVAVAFEIGLALKHRLGAKYFALEVIALMIPSIIAIVLMSILQ